MVTLDPLLKNTAKRSGMNLSYLLEEAIKARIALDEDKDYNLIRLENEAKELEQNIIDDQTRLAAIKNKLIQAELKQKEDEDKVLQEKVAFAKGFVRSGAMAEMVDRK